MHAIGSRYLVETNAHDMEGIFDISRKKKGIYFMYARKFREFFLGDVEKLQ